MADNYPMDLPLALGRRWRVAHNSTGSTTTNKAFERRGSWAGSMRQQEHLDEATAACWVTFCSEAIRTKVLIVAQHRPLLGGGFGAWLLRRAGLLVPLRHSLIGHSAGQPNRSGGFGAWLLRRAGLLVPLRHSLIGHSAGQPNRIRRASRLRKMPQ